MIIHSGESTLLLLSALFCLMLVVYFSCFFVVFFGSILIEFRHFQRLMLYQQVCLI